MALTFNTDTYLQNKVNQLNKTGETNPSGGLWTTSQVEQAFADAGLSAEDHYARYGADEGVSPYDDFDTDTYLQNKAESLGDGWDSDSVLSAFDDAGLSILEHFERYGRGEGIDPTPNAVTMFGDDISGLETGSYSGLSSDHIETLLDSLIPKLLESVEGYETNIDDATNAAYDLYNSQARQSMDTAAQNTLNDLGSRGIFSGTVASDALGKAMSDVALDSADKTFETGLASAAMKAQTPTILGNLIGLGNYSESYNELAPYELLMNSYLNMQ